MQTLTLSNLLDLQCLENIVLKKSFANTYSETVSNKKPSDLKTESRSKFSFSDLVKIEKSLVFIINTLSFILFQKLKKVLGDMQV